MQVQLRVATDADKHAIQQLDDLARLGDPDRNNLIDDAVARCRCLVAEGPEVVGYVVTTPKHFFGRDFVDLLIVHDTHRRRGVGRALLRAAVDRANSSRVFSSTNESNTAMQSLFRSESWKLSGRLDGLDQSDPELVYFIDQQS